tara:strand:- start:21 stop:212 length:192 start_codon:yes stop_codon:yes gene_type:complete
MDLLLEEVEVKPLEVDDGREVVVAIVLLHGGVVGDDLPAPGPGVLKLPLDDGFPARDRWGSQY